MAGTEEATHPPAPRQRSPRPPRAPGRVWLVAAAIGAAAAVAAYAAMPNKGAEPARFHGDPEPVEAVAASLDGVEDRVQGMVLLLHEDSRESYAAGGTADGGTEVTPQTPFATGSVFKLFTAMTLADMAENGETSLDRTLGEIYPEMDFADSRLAEATLEELATHRSGLARVPDETLALAAFTAFTATDPYRRFPAPAESLAEASAAEPGEYAYSNFGYAVLGDALERESGTPYPDLVRERVLDPLGMADTVIRGADTEALPSGAALPYVEPGARAQAWHAPHYAPAGVGTWSTPDDLMRFTTAAAEGTAPGMSALEPAYEGPDEESRMGLAWMMSDFGEGVELSWHSGGTYGATAFVGYQEDRAVVAVSNSFAVDAASPAIAAMGGSEGAVLAESPIVAGTGLLAAQTLAMTLIPLLLASALVLRRVTLVGQRSLDRLRVISMPLGASAALLAAQRVGSWVAVPPAVWALAVGGVAAALAVGVWHWPRLPAVQARWPRVRVAFFVLSVAVSALLALVTLGALAVSNLD